MPHRSSIGRQSRAVADHTEAAVLSSSTADSNRSRASRERGHLALDGVAVLDKELEAGGLCGLHSVERVVPTIDGATVAVADRVAAAVNLCAGRLEVGDLVAQLTLVVGVDPAEDPEAVAARYRQVRLDAFGPQRRVSEKRARLAEFTLDGSSAGSWWERMCAWNERCEQFGHPEWRYGQSSNFQRDTAAALSAAAA